ncbi:prolyl oligopeptidase family serine peptidase [Gimesia sp.]|uniref:prolyl oligopeptidase family serine peptidase n=1 Tax=Gimesia sp. TaxID=2024833 RepID=UPI003A8D5147
MVDPQLVKCPQCAAAFRIKKKSAFGKKVKCPKCETPFVIPEPVSIKSSSSSEKPKPLSLAEEFFGDESESSYSLADDEFDNWEDDLNHGSSDKKSPPRKKQQTEESGRKSKRYRSEPTQSNRYVPLIAVAGFIVFLFTTFILVNLFFPQGNKPDRLAGGGNLNDTDKLNLGPLPPIKTSWPNQGGQSDLVFRERKTASSAKVYDLVCPGNKTVTGIPQKFRVYLPPDIPENTQVPCVLVPPAGATMLTGMDIDLNDTSLDAEHEPYIKAGFAVITFSIDGPIGDIQQTTDNQFVNSHMQFRESRAGVINCVNAFHQVIETVPNIDRKNIFIAGHSSAATLSLLFAEYFSKVFQGSSLKLKGCLAYAPATDSKSFLKENLPIFKRIIPDVEQFIKISSPSNYSEKIDCPVFLFHSTGDRVTSYTDTAAFTAQLQKQGIDVEFSTSNGADHYQTMIDFGIPRGISWIQKQTGGQQDPLPQSKPDSSPGSAPNALSDSMVKMNKKIREQGAETKARMERMRKQFQNSAFKEKPDPNTPQQRAIFKISGYNDFYTQAMKNDPTFWTRSIENSVESGLTKIVGGYIKGSVRLDLQNQLLSFNFTGNLPDNLPQLLAEDHRGKAVKLDQYPPVIEGINNTPSGPNSSQGLLFKITFLKGFNFDQANFMKVAEIKLKQLDQYVPGSLKLNLEEKWVFVKVTDDESVIYQIRNLFSNAGVSVDLTPTRLTPENISKYENYGSTANPSKMIDLGSTASQANTSQKYVILYGVYGGDDAKESVKRSLKGFVWVDQKSIQFNPHKKEISFINRSPVDTGALERALNRNKFYQLAISQEAVPAKATEPDATKKATPN